MIHPYDILKPIFVMALLFAVTMGRLAYLRLTAIRQKKVPLDYFKTFQKTDVMIPESMAATARHLMNLFEVPVLFYVVSILIYITGAVDHTFVILAWIYVACRAAHTAVHLTVNIVQARFVAFFLSNITLVILWIKLAFHIFGNSTGFE